MLDQLRQGAQGWVSKVLMGLLVLSFAIWGISGQFSGYGAGTLATVGNVEVSTAEFARRHQQLQNAAQQSGRQVSPEQVLDQMLLNAALEDEAMNYKLGVSDAEVAKEIAADPRFHGQNGSFDRDALPAHPRKFRPRPRRLRARDARRAPAQPDRRLDRHRHRRAAAASWKRSTASGTRSGRSPSSSSTTPQSPRSARPTRRRWKTYFEANKQRFQAPEYRKLGVLVADPAALADPAAVTDVEVAAEYEARKASFTQPERRRIEQLRFATKEAAEAALKQSQGGADFAALVQAGGKTLAEVDLGMKTMAEIIDPKVAEVAFAAPQGAVVPVVEGALEPSLIRVTAMEPGSVTPLAEVAPRLRQEIATKAAREKVRDLYDQIEDERAGGATLEEIGKTLELPYRVVEGVARDGTAPDGSPIADLPVKDQLLTEAFESDVGVENNPLRGGEESYVFYDVLEIEPARDRTLDEVKDAVVKAWTDEETANRIAERRTPCSAACRRASGSRRSPPRSASRCRRWST